MPTRRVMHNVLTIRLQEEMEVQEEHAVLMAAAMRLVRGSDAPDASPAHWRTVTVDRMATFYAVRVPEPECQRGDSENDAESDPLWTCKDEMREGPVAYRDGRVLQQDLKSYTEEEAQGHGPCRNLTTVPCSSQ